MLEDFSQPWEVYIICTHKTKLATKHELDTVYSLSDIYDFLEMIDVYNALEKDAHDRAEKDNK